MLYANAVEILLGVLRKTVEMTTEYCVAALYRVSGFGEGDEGGEGVEGGRGERDRDEW